MAVVLSVITDFWHLLNFCLPGHFGLSAQFVDLAVALIVRSHAKAGLQSTSAFFL